MGFVYSEIIVHGRKGSKKIRALVDTGATYLVLSPEIVTELDLIETPYKVSMVLADKRRVEARLFLAQVEVAGRRGPVFVAELDTPTPILGVYALETLGFKVNPVTGELEEISPEGGYLL